MAGTSSIGGLVSGLDTASIISQLLAVEGNRQTLLKQQVLTQQSVLSRLQAINAKTASVATAAEALTRPETWNVRSVESSLDSVKASATPDAAIGTYSFTITETAAAHRLTFNTTARPTDVVVSGGTSITVTDSTGAETTLDTGDGTLAGLMSAINNSDTGLRATTITLDDGTQRLSVAATTTGAAGSFTLTNTADGSALLGDAVVTQGRDAAITIGTDTIHSATNTFADVFGGLTFTLAAGATTGETVDLTVNTDGAAVADKVKALVDLVNDVLAQIDAGTASDPANSRVGTLASNSTVRSLREQLISTVTHGVGGGTLADVGIEVTRDGVLEFDQEKFTETFEADPAKTQSYFTSSTSFSGTGQAHVVATSWKTVPGTYAINATVTGGVVSGTIDGRPGTASGTMLSGADGSPAQGLAVSVTGSANGTITYVAGFAASLERVAKLASDSAVGLLTSTIDGTTDTIDRLEDSIADWDDRLAMRRTALERQYAALEVALSSLQNQAQWLNGQIAMLPRPE